MAIAGRPMEACAVAHNQPNHEPTAPLTAVPYTIPIAGGAFHTPEHYVPFSYELERRGHTTINPDFDSGDVASSFEKDAEVFVESLGDADRLFFFVHSRGIERFARAIPKIDPKRIIGGIVITSAGPHGLLVPPAHAGELPQPRYKPLLETGVSDVAPRLQAYDRNVAPKTFYSELPNDVATWAAGLMVKQRVVSVVESPIPPMPADIPIYYVLGDRDEVINNARAERVPKLWLGPDAAPAIYIDSGHSPFLERIPYLADLVIEKATLAEAIKLNRAA